jgi:hypothetical protein
VLPAVEPTRHLSLLALPLLGWAATRARGPSRTVAMLGLAALVFAMGPVLGTYQAAEQRTRRAAGRRWTRPHTVLNAAA